MKASVREINANSHLRRGSTLEGPTFCTSILHELKKLTKDAELQVYLRQHETNIFRLRNVPTYENFVILGGYDLLLTPLQFPGLADSEPMRQARHRFLES